MPFFSRKIPISELRPGMFVGDVLNSRGVVLYTAETLITRERQIETLKKQGVTELYIQAGRENEPIDVAVESAPDVDDGFFGNPVQLKLRQYEQTLQEARTVHLDTIETVKKAMNGLRMGRAFSIGTVVKATENMIERVLSDPDVFMALCLIKDRDKGTYNHCVNVAVITTALASALGFSRERISELGIGCMLHDIGKMRIPEEVLKKQGRYTRAEFELMKKHPQLGLDVLDSRRRIPEAARNVIAQHHERWNGGGYPLGLKGEQIDELAMLCALGDVYDALTTEGSYRRQCLPQEALALIFQGSEEEYPRRLVEHFTKLLGIYPVGSFVKLESGEMGLVIRINRQSLLTPTVLILFGEDGSRLESPYIRDLSTARQELERSSWKIELSLDPSNFSIDPARYFSSPGR